MVRITVKFQRLQFDQNGSVFKLGLCLAFVTAISQLWFITNMQVELGQVDMARRFADVDRLKVTRQLGR